MVSNSRQKVHCEWRKYFISFLLSTTIFDLRNKVVWFWNRMYRRSLKRSQNESFYTMTCEHTHRIRKFKLNKIKGTHLFQCCILQYSILKAQAHYYDFISGYNNDSLQTLSIL